MAGAVADGSVVTAAESIRALYSELALHPRQEFGWGKGRENARRLGYDARWLDTIPEPVWESAAAVGNPFGLGPIERGMTVVDLGCGAGADLCIAALLVGAHGRAIGIDLTPAMAVKAQASARLMGLGNVAVHSGDMTAVPLEDGAADRVISNGAINLSPAKSCVFREVFRILKPGGCFWFADMVRESATAPAQGGGSWADCVAGTVAPERIVEMLAAAGFRDAELVAFTGYKTAPTTTGATFRARKP